MRRRGSGYFQGTSNSSQQLMLASRPFFPPQQKGNRCAVMSTVDYSCNIARKKKNMRPRSMDRLRVISCPSCQADSFQEANRGVGSFLFSTADRETIVHTHSWVHVCAALLFPNIERSAAYALAISCSAGLTCSRPGGI